MKQQHPFTSRLLRRSRCALGLSQTHVAKELLYTPQFICNWERGVSGPPPYLIKRIASLYKIPLKDLCKAYEKDMLLKFYEEVYDG